jgi:predicted Ser/Thr protein kinase
MRSIEEKIDIPESRKDDFRREIMNYIGSLALQGKTFRYDSNPRLHKALELKLFEDQKDSIKLTSIVSNVVDKETQEKIEVVKTRLIKEYGYCDICANDIFRESWKNSGVERKAFPAPPPMGPRAAKANGSSRGTDQEALVQLITQRVMEALTKR